MEAPSFAAAVLEGRRRRGWSQARLGDEAGLPQSHIAKIENGADVRVSTVLRVMVALGYQAAFSPMIAEPPAKSALERAREYGIDVDSLLMSLDMTPKQRYDRAISAINGILDLLAHRKKATR